ncbi:hypothetical protein MKW98_028509 [Papaver atlanticum]|uniref:Uncharacterized protein n=1 Tax=Papaver atlanticum TaxID=357466 RepID=A0AAD4TDL9_9MAGN|nr:hypothetical protein MKW98_028509 [Papaver atlanticum]
MTHLSHQFQTERKTWVPRTKESVFVTTTGGQRKNNVSSPSPIIFGGEIELLYIFADAYDELTEQLQRPRCWEM